MKIICNYSYNNKRLESPDTSSYKQSKLVGDTFVKNHNFSAESISFEAVTVSHPAEAILDGLNSMNIAVYNSLAEQQRACLRGYSPFNQAQMANIIDLQGLLQRELEKRFPQGYTLAAVGRSPAVFSPIFEAKGIAAKSVPISGMSGIKNAAEKIPDEGVLEYGKYLMQQGISRDVAESSCKPFVFVDYTRSGLSLENFKRILARANLGLEEGKSAFFIRLNDVFSGQIAESILTDLFYYEGIKKLSPIPTLPYMEIALVEERMRNFPPSRISKSFLFHVIDYLEQSKQA